MVEDVEGLAQQLEADAVSNGVRLESLTSS